MLKAKDRKRMTDGTFPGGYWGFETFLPGLWKDKRLTLMIYSKLYFQNSLINEQIITDKVQSFKQDMKIDLIVLQPLIFWILTQ